NKVTAVRASAYLDMLDDDVALDREKAGKKPLKARESESKTKNTKTSTTDPESGFMTRDNKPQGFFYLDHRTVDGQHGIILDTYTTAGNINDSQPYVQRLDYTLATFQLNPIAVGLDAGYFTAPVAESLERRGILG
ncbi:transposase, partial [Vibrio vulnificus]|nr:transposase [Vibrio vulnificus]